MKVYIEGNNLQVELLRYRKLLDLIHIYFCIYSMQYGKPIGHQNLGTFQTNEFDHCNFLTGKGDSNPLLVTPFLRVWGDSRARVNASTSV